MKLRRTYPLFGKVPSFACSPSRRMDARSQWSAPNNEEKGTSYWIGVAPLAGGETKRIYQVAPCGRDIRLQGPGLGC
jgi:hypothetical protein